MGMNNEPGRFPEVLELLNRAIESPRGIRVSYPRAGDAFTVRMRIYTKINDSRKESKELFEYGTPMWGKSPYDGLSISMDPPYDPGRKEEPAALVLKLIDDEYFQLKGIKIEEL